MARKSKLEVLAAERDCTPQEMLQTLYAQHQSQTAVAASIGVSQATVSGWLKVYNMQERTILREVQHEPVR